jgi:acyl dehydratase
MSGEQRGELIMPIDYEALLSLKIPEVEHRYEHKDVILYALGIGLGRDPVDEDQLCFVYEKNLRVLPTFPVVLGRPDFWIRDLPTGIDFATVLHGEQGVVLHRQLEPRGHIVATTRVTDVVDKGPGKGALVYTERRIFDKATGELRASVTETAFCRSEGGFGGPQRPQNKLQAVPEREADRVCDFQIRPEAALIYRLSGDLNPLHVEPAAARGAGYERPILQGLATFGVGGLALLRTYCDYDPARLTSIAGRFTAPVFPGDTIRTEMWQDELGVTFRARVLERDILAINNGRATIAFPSA